MLQFQTKNCFLPLLLLFTYITISIILYQEDNNVRGHHYKNIVKKFWNTVVYIVSKLIKYVLMFQPLEMPKLIEMTTLRDL